MPAARAAARLYRTALARGVEEGRAWQDAAEVFALHHPTWPLPLAERETARTVGALIARERATVARTPARTAPLALLRRLAQPALPGPALAFRRIAPVRAGAWPMPARLPVLRFPASPPLPGASPC